MRFVFVLLAFVFLAACSSGDKLLLKKVSYQDIEGWKDESHEEALAVFLSSCKKIAVQKERSVLFSDSLYGDLELWKKTCSDVASNSVGDNAKVLFEHYFVPHSVSNRGNKKGLFTGYYELALNGSFKKSDRYRYPIYKKPDDYVAGALYFSRKEIDGGALAGKGYELLYVDDPVRLFFLHIQGSGRVKLENGSEVNVGFSAKNGHPYGSIGKYLIEKGYIPREKMSAEAIQKWLYENPDKRDFVMQRNASYIFFRQLSGAGPVGAQGVPLTPMRSLAVDKRYIPYGAPLWLDVPLDQTPNYPSDRMRQIVVAQDTGSAIKGVVRGDIFFGYGLLAEERANYNQSEGEYYILLPRQGIEYGS